jgi:hypothetical protein
MSNNLNLTYSFTPNNNTTYVKYNNCIGNNNSNTNNNTTAMSNIVNTNPSHVSSYLNSPILLFTKTVNTDVDKYKSPYGIPFECVELIRRILSTQCNYTFPSIVDAEDMFYSINTLYNISDNSTTVSLKTYQYPYGSGYENPNKIILSYLKPGNLLFWKKIKDDYDFKYGHVAIIISVTNFQVTIAQQNRNPPIQIYNIAELVGLLNLDNSYFLGIKVIPQNLSEFLSSKLKNIQVKHFDR